MIDVAADESRDDGNYIYETITWKNLQIKIEPLQIRYGIEQQREREERIEAIEEYMNNIAKNNIKQ
jgi:hypothetical protein